ncbi:TonB-dependent receptor plug [Pseudopedobacter saltans DSM 12145]|uniref:TonB-dependent receptor plug n=1 Tax=Pseudopedobacter saltans (strain ATCC 51119 / DSM 12145 / JCM 21818 / CCUG 39354 / LMG 10337 / NBRC 100064 / NCIMB 13643) TaxID=762903 RepID=F0SAS4_PSESL|nr:TonB-dependent receptor [Pseudopedobacter saltans]ADY53695.1 TonB-dependent receptor plug [Pseudopedobacter saltans DSM 12145]
MIQELSLFLRIKLIVPLLFLIVSTSFAQNQTTVSGIVKSATDGEPLPGVAVSVKGTTAGTLTDIQGRFVINIPKPGAVLVFSSLGFSTQEITANSASLNVTLSENLSALNEVVVVGYGTTRKQDLTGAVTVVGAKDFQKGTVTTPEQMITGKVPGVSIVSNGGQPGSGATIRIRGGASLSANNDPLFVIDGVPLENSTVSGASNPLSFINPNDIESFTVLKDASATAIYGSRASNGVIIITTKKGSSGKLNINFSTVNALSSITKYADVLSADQFRAVVNEFGTADQKADLGQFSTDWQKLIYQDGFNTDNNISFSGGVKNLPYRLSFGYQNQSGILKTDKYQKTSAALALNPTFFDNHLKVDLNIKGSMQNTRFANQAAIGGAVSFDPSQAVYTNLSDYGGYWEWMNPTNPSGLENLVGRNPVGLLNQRFDNAKPYKSIGNLSLEYKFHFLPDLKAVLNLGYDISTGKGTVYVPATAAELIDQGGTDSKYKQNKTNTVADFYLNYVKELNDIKSRLEVTAGYSYNDYLTKVYNYTSYNALGAVISEPAFPFDKPHSRNISYFGRLNYNYDERYYLTGTVRTDGSSRFAEGNRYGTFPAIAFSWAINNESFLQDSKHVNLLKLRLSYGLTGQQDINALYGYMSYYNLSTINASYQFGDQYYQMYRPSAYISDLKWEQTATSNIALDFGLFNNKVSGSIDLYKRKTSDLLNKIPQPAGTNFSATAYVNVGDMENEGVELNLNVVPVENKNFKWDAGFNLTYNKNTITNLTVVPNDPNYLGFPGGTIAGGVSGQYAFINAVGSPKNTFFLYKQVYDENGKPLEGIYVDANKDGKITTSDFVKGKSSDPKVFLGFTNNLSYKKWSSAFVLRASLGNYVYNNAFSQRGNLAQFIGTQVLLNGSPNYFETGFKTQQLLSDYYVENGSFLKMDNFSIGYDFGRIARNTANLRVNAYVQNVFTITKYKGLDPEVASGVDNNIYPRPRIYSLGLNLNF